MKILLNYEYTAVLNAKNFYLKVDLWYKLTFTTKQVCTFDPFIPDEVIIAQVDVGLISLYNVL